MLRLDDRWAWDFWIADTGSDYHLFFLNAPRSLGDPNLRHHRAVVGHAVSSDLVHWEELGQALRPGPEGAWDDVAIWTGSVVRGDDAWYMFYTGSSKSEGALIQRIGLATSPDLMTWTKHPANLIIEADPAWYQQLDTTAWHDQASRDPWVFADPDGHGAQHGPGSPDLVFGDFSKDPVYLGSHVAAFHGQAHDDGDVLVRGNAAILCCADKLGQDVDVAGGSSVFGFDDVHCSGPFRFGF